MIRLKSFFKHTQSPIWSGVRALSSRFLDLPSRYGFHLLVAAALGVVDSGRFYIVFSLVFMISGLGRLGLDRALTREVAIVVAQKKQGDVFYALQKTFFTVLILSAFVISVFCISSGFISEKLFNKPYFRQYIILSSIIIIPQNISTVFAGFLAGRHRISSSQMLYSWLWPSVFCVLCFPFVFLSNFYLNLAILLIFISFIVVDVVGYMLIDESIKPYKKFHSQYFVSMDFLKSGLSFFTLELTQLCISSGPTLFLGIASTVQNTGLFSLAWRLALVINLIINGVSSLVAPKFASLYAENKISEINGYSLYATVLSIGISFPIMIFLVIFPKNLLSIFGSGYSTAAHTLCILAVGQFLASCFTAMPELLAMAGYFSILRRINFISVLVLVVALLILVSNLGSDGAAYAVSLSLITNGALSGWFAHKKLKICGIIQIYQLVQNIIKNKNF